MNVPLTLVAGDTWEWTESLSSYPASDGWSLAVHLRGFGLTVINLSSAASGDDHVVSAKASATATHLPGKYSWSALVTKGVGDDAERHQVGSGYVTVEPNMATATATTEIRTPARIMLDNLESAIKRLASREVESVQYNGRTVTYKDLGKLLRDRGTLRLEVAREDEAAKVAGGLQTGRRILTRFSE